MAGQSKALGSYIEEMIFMNPLGEIRWEAFRTMDSSISGRSITGALYVGRTRFYMGENLGILLV